MKTDLKKAGLIVLSIAALLISAFLLNEPVVQSAKEERAQVQDEAMDMLINKDANQDKKPALPEVKKKLKAAPDFSLQDIYQDDYTLSSYKGKQAVLLFFWTTWCPFCQRELQVLNDTYPQLVQQDIEVLSIDSGEDPDKVTNFVRDYNLAYRVLLDKDTAVSNSYGITGVPTYVLVNIDGNIVFQDNFYPQQEIKDLNSK